MHRTDHLLLAALLLLNLVLKCSWLGVDPLYHDEPFTVYWSQQPWGTLWPMLATENNPPLYFLLIKAWSAVVPFQATWLRVPAAVFSALAVVPLFLLAHRVAGRRAAMVAALVFTFSNYHYAYAHEVRAYALFTLLAITSVWLLARAAQQAGYRTLIGLAVVDVLMVYTHFFGWLMMGVQVLLVVVLPEWRPRWRSLAGALIAVAVAYLPYATVFSTRLGQSVAHGTWLEPPVAEEMYNMLWRWNNQPVLVVLSLVLIAAACVKHRMAPLGLRLGLVWALVPLLGMFALSVAVPMFLDRYLVYAAPGYALLLGVATDSLLPIGRMGRWASSIPVLGMLLTFTPWKGHGRTPQRVVEQAEAWCHGNCLLEIRPTWYELNYRATKDIDLLRSTPTAAPAPLASPQSVVVVDAGADAQDPQRQWRVRLDATFPQVDSVQADHKVWVYRFSR